jgi:hypothetical protein
MLIRKIDKGKWISQDTVIEPPSADALTKDLPTKRNTLSVWYIDNETELEEAVLAIISGQPHSLETIDIVILEDTYLINNNINIEKTNGETPVVDLKERHRDLSSLNCWTLVKIAEYIAENIKNNNIRRYRKADLRRIIKNAVSEERLSFYDLSDSIRVQLYN